MKAVTRTSLEPGEGSPKVTMAISRRMKGVSQAGCASPATWASAQTWQCAAPARSAWLCAISNVMKTRRVRHKTPRMILPNVEVGFIAGELSA